MTSTSDLLWYRLFQTEGFGPRARHIIWEGIRDSGFSLERLFGMDRAEFESTFPALGSGRLRRANFDALQSLDEDKLYEEYQALKDSDIEIVHPGHQLYPDSFSALVQRGLLPILFCRGETSLLESQGIAIVGSRNASEEGVRISRQFAGDLALRGENVISGYAKGIDMNAHLGALEKDGTTTIVLSFGILRFSRKPVLDESTWESKSLVVSQFHPAETWNAGNAMSRNKLVCALGKAVIVIECGREQDENGNRSGTFDAGKTALEMSIPLFVVSPNSFKNPPVGNKQLLKRGGIEIQPSDGIAAVLEHLNVQSTEGAKPAPTQEQFTIF